MAGDVDPFVKAQGVGVGFSGIGGKVIGGLVFDDDGDLVEPAGELRGEIGEVFSGTLRGRTAPDQIMLFKSLGQAVEDAATALHVYERARAAGVGLQLAL